MRIPKTYEQVYRELLEKGTRTEKGCLICHLAPNKKGYPPLTVGGRTAKKWRANRFVWKMSGQKLDDDMMILHTCDNRRCIEITHLYEGTAKDNTDDMMLKDRHQNGSGKQITVNDVNEMKGLYGLYKSYRLVGKILGLSESCVQQYVKGLRHVR